MEVWMKSRSSIVSCLLALVVVSGCASTKITQSESNIGNGRLARPNNILIYDFAATPADVPADAAVTGQAASQKAHDVATGRQLGAQIATAVRANANWRFDRRKNARCIQPCGSRVTLPADRRRATGRVARSAGRLESVGNPRSQNESRRQRRAEFFPPSSRQSSSRR